MEGYVMTTHSTTFSLAALLTVTLCAGQAAAQVPEAIAAPGETALATIYAVGAQIYECKAGADGKLSWAFREPIAALFVDGKTVGRHYAGPNWDLTDGSGVTAKVAGNAPAKSANDIPWLKLQVTDARGNGTLTRATTVQRINTQGGVFSGPCDKAGAFHAAPYSADYVFLGKGN
jgi:hypothetical protein